MTTKTLTFYTTGESLTNLLRDLIQSGEFKKVNQILLEQLPLNEVKAFYEGKSTFTYEVSDKQGDVVRGVKSDLLLKPEVYDELRSIARDLYNDLQIPIQIEFVVDKNDKLYIVQLRELKNHFEKTAILSRPEASEVIVNGQTFSKGHEKVKVEDILIIDSDGESKLLLGKKALIVKSDVQFSHLLALSKALEIPSIFNTGEVDLSGYDEVDFCAYNKEAWIGKITE